MSVRKGRVWWLWRCPLCLQGRTGFADQSAANDGFAQHMSSKHALDPTRQALDALLDSLFVGCSEDVRDVADHHGIPLGVLVRACDAVRTHEEMQQ